MEKKTKVYVAGKVSGLPYAEACLQFFAAKATLLSLHPDYNVVLPIEYCRSWWSWWLCMRVCLGLLKQCDKIYLLPNWKKSKGARIERFMAWVWDIEILEIK